VGYEIRRSDRVNFRNGANVDQTANMSEWGLKMQLAPLTLNHRVPGSSPGAPTKLFKHLAVI
jgi:hypothetical protein